MESTIRWSEARCASGDARLLHLFFSDDAREIEEAKALCRSCPLRLPCLRGAVERGEPEGVWGGHLFDEGRAVAMKRPRGRPPKELLRRQREVEQELLELGIA